jgi:hypothetical protein
MMIIVLAANPIGMIRMITARCLTNPMILGGGTPILKMVTKKIWPLSRHKLVILAIACSFILVFQWVAKFREVVKVAFLVGFAVDGVLLRVSWLRQRTSFIGVYSGLWLNESHGCVIRLELERKVPVVIWIKAGSRDEELVAWKSEFGGELPSLQWCDSARFFQ